MHRYNASLLEDWCRMRGVAAEGVASQLAPVIQASKLLQMKKSSEADVEAICDLCTQLNALQVYVQKSKKEIFVDNFSLFAFGFRCRRS